MLSTTLPTLTIPIRQRLIERRCIIEHQFHILYLRYVPIRQRLIESLCETEHTIHIRYARHCGGGSGGRRRRDRSNGDDSMMQPTQSKRHTYVSLQ